MSTLIPTLIGSAAGVAIVWAIQWLTCHVWLTRFERKLRQRHR